MPKFLFLFILLLFLPTLAQTPAELRYYMKQRTRLQGEESLEPIRALLQKKPELAITPIPRLNGTGQHLPLNEALFIGDVEVAELLLKNGADANAPSGRKEVRPLGWAMNDFVSPEKTEAMVVLLLKNKADPNLTDKVGNTAVHRWAARRSLRNEERYPTLLNLLVEAGADPQATNESGFTPLMIAVTNSNAPAVKLLLAKGADPDLKTRFGTARQLAEEQARRPTADAESGEVLELVKTAQSTKATATPKPGNPKPKETRTNDKKPVEATPGMKDADKSAPTPDPSE